MASHSATLYRHAVWQGTVPLCITLDDAQAGAGFRERLVDCYYVRLRMPLLATSPCRSIRSKRHG
jgi:hypothetical protein